MEEEKKEIVEEQGQLNEESSINNDISQVNEESSINNDISQVNEENDINSDINQETNTMNNEVNQVQDTNDVNEENNKSQETINENDLNLKRSNSKKDAIIVVLIFIIVLLLAVVLLYYFNHKDDKQGGSDTPVSTSTPIPSTPEPTASTLSNDEAIKIAKEKIEMANEFSNNDKCFGKEPEEGSIMCYYGSVDELKNDFYKIYSSKLSYKDVMIEYKTLTTSTDWSTNIKLEGDMLDGVPSYVISNNKAYRNSCTIGSGTYSSVAKFTVNSITADRIMLDYVVMEQEPDVDYAKETEREDATIILVKENNDWKILKATIADMCNGVYTVGKES